MSWLGRIMILLNRRKTSPVGDIISQTTGDLIVGRRFISACELGRAIINIPGTSGFLLVTAAWVEPVRLSG